ncbi:LPXTG cell wall anchor domain-containing protein [Enterococcus sp. AZ196]|uniref:LPXTG cell wall anchor domain-containing protein n=1 Tax=Enterococcus sp. AZ196 TaxID=2774659 RepID=UPI003D2B6718
MKKNAGKLLVVLMLILRFLPVTELSLAATTEPEPLQNQQSTMTKPLKEAVPVSSTSSSSVSSASKISEISQTNQSAASSSDKTTISISKSQLSAKTVSSTSASMEPKKRLAKAEQPTITIDYEQESLTGFDAGAEYSLSYDSTTVPINGAVDYPIAEVMMGKTLTIIRKGDGGSIEDSEAQLLTLPKRPVVTSSYVRVSDESSLGANDGSLGAMGADMEYRLKGDGEWLVLPHYTTGTGPLAPGDYEIRFKAVQSKNQFKSLTYIQKIKAGIDREEIPKVTIDYEKETLEGFDPAGKYEVKYDASTQFTVDGETSLKITDGTNGTTNMFSKVWKITKKNTDSTRPDSVEQKLTIKARQQMMNNWVTAKDETAKDKNDGQLTSIYADREYRMVGDQEWIRGNANNSLVTGLKPGEYEIRIAASNANQQFVSNIIKKTINPGIAREEMPNITIDYQKELLEGFDSSGKYELRFGEKAIPVSSETAHKITEEMFGKGWKIVRLGDGSTTQDSEAQSLTIAWRPAFFESHLYPQHESVKGANDGVLASSTRDTEYRKKGEMAWIAMDTSTGESGPLAPGTYEIRRKADQATGKFNSVILECTILPGLAREERPNITVDYEEERLEGFDVAASYKISFNQDVVLVTGAATFKIPEEMLLNRVWKVVKEGDGQNTQDSEPQDLLIKSRPFLSETSIKAEDETEKDRHDGKLTGVSLDREYRMLGDTDWNKGSSNGQVGGLKPGDYEIRYAPSNASEKFASNIVTKTIEAGLITEETPEFAIDYEKELLTNLDPTATYELKVVDTFPPHTETGESFTIASGSSTYQIKDDMLGKRWFIIRKARSSEYNDSVEQSIYLDKRWTINVTTFTAIKETQPGVKDGKLKNIFKNAHYRKKGEMPWLEGATNGTIENLEETVYEIQYKADAGQRMFASKIVEVDLAQGLIQKIKPAIKIDYEREVLYDYLPNEQYKTASYVVDHWINAPQPKNLEVPITEEMFETWTYINIEGQSGVSVSSDIQKFVIPARQTIDEKNISVENESYMGAEDGRLTGIFPTMEYRKSGTNTWHKGTVDGIIKDLSVGSYEVRLASSNTAQKFASLSINKQIKAGIPKAETPQLSVNYEEEMLDGLDESAEYQITVESKNYPVKAMKSYALLPEMFGKTISIVRLGDGKNRLTSDPQQLTIKARPTFDEKAIQVVNESSKNKKDGQLKGLTADMEYRKVGDTAWHRGTQDGVISNLASGTYEIRLASSNDDQRFASESIEKTIKTDTENKTPVIPDDRTTKPSSEKPVIKPTTKPIPKSVNAPKTTRVSSTKTLLKAGDEKSITVTLIGMGMLTGLALYWRKRQKKY